MQDQFEADFAIWRREHESAANLRQTLREDAIRQECRAERDRQIDAIVAKVDAESLEQQRSLDEKLWWKHVFYYWNFYIKKQF